MSTVAFLFAAIVLIAGCQTAVLAPGPSGSRSGVETSVAPAYYYFSMAQLKMKQGDINEAVWLIKQAIGFDPASVYLNLELADLLLIKKESDQALALVERVISVAPDNARAWTMAGQIYAQQDNTDEAVGAYEKALELQPAEQNIYLVVGRIYWNRNDLNSAERVFRQMAANIPDSYAAFYFYGKVLEAQGKTDDAERALLHSLELEPGFKEPLIELLNIYKQQNRPDKVTTAYQAILRQSPQDRQAAFGLAQHYHQLDQNTLSLGLLEQLGAEIPNDERIISTFFEIYLEKKQYTEAIWALNGMLHAAPENSELHYMAGIAYDGIEENDTAIAHLLEVSPGSRFYTNAVVHGALLLHDKGQIDRAIALVEQALQHFPEHVAYYLYLGSFYEELGRLDDALNILQDGIRQDNNNARLYFRFGVVLDKLGRKQESIAAMKNVIELAPDDAEALNYLGYTYADMGINLDEAHSLIQSALALKPDDGYIADSLGWVYYKQGQYRQALEWLNKAIKLVADDPAILEHLGDVHMKLEQKEKALDFYRRSLKKKDNGREAIEEKIRILEGH